jgi:hypothetical protein
MVRKEIGEYERLPPSSVDDSRDVMNEVESNRSYGEREGVGVACGDGALLARGCRGRARERVEPWGDDVFEPLPREPEASSNGSGLGAIYVGGSITDEADGMRS